VNVRMEKSLGFFSQRPQAKIQVVVCLRSGCRVCLAPMFHDCVSLSGITVVHDGVSRTESWSCIAASIIAVSPSWLKLSGFTPMSRSRSTSQELPTTAIGKADGSMLARALTS